MDVPFYNQEGKETGKVTLPENVFNVPWNADLVHQVIVSMEANVRTPIAHTKDRGDVSGGGKKPWRQKGTGRARHGSIRSPIWRGGGVTHGPRNEKDYTKKINKKMRVKALYTVLSQKLRDNEILFVESVKMTEPKTKNARAMLFSWAAVGSFAALKTKRNNAALIALATPDANTTQSFHNFGNILVDEVRNMNPRVVLQYKYVIISEPVKAIEILEKRNAQNAKQ